MQRIRIRSAAGVAALAVVTLAASAAPALSSTSEPDWHRALRLRSEALNCLYGLGDCADGRMTSRR